RLLRGGHDMDSLRKLIQEFTGQLIGFITPGQDGGASLLHPVRAPLSHAAAHALLSELNKRVSTRPPEPRLSRGGHYMAHQALSRAFASLLDAVAPCRQIGSGFEFTEGPIWHPRDQYLLFSDIPPSIRRRWDAKGCSEFLKPSNKGNGMTYDRDLNLLVCEHATSSVARFSEGRREVLAHHFEGKELNSPNDIIAASDGAVWFSDPTYGRMPVYGIERPCELDFRGVYRIAAGGGPLQLVV